MLLLQGPASPPPCLPVDGRIGAEQTSFLGQIKTAQVTRDEGGGGLRYWSFSLPKAIELLVALHLLETLGKPMKVF